MGIGTPNRRKLLALGAGLASVATGWQFWLGREKRLAFQPITGLPGWRRVTFDDVTAISGSVTNAVFLGLDASESLPPLSPQSLCATLYPKAGKGIPAAVFTDVNCPNCTRLEAKLKARSNRLLLNWHDLPLLGQTSETAARAMVAGDLQLGGDIFRQAVLTTSPGRLMSATIVRLADQSGLNTQQLLKDMDSPKVAASLNESRRAAETLGVWGTPGFTIGRTFVLGDMHENVLDQLIKEEADANPC